MQPANLLSRDHEMFSWTLNEVGKEAAAHSANPRARLNFPRDCARTKRTMSSADQWRECDGELRDVWTCFCRLEAFAIAGSKRSKSGSRGN